MLKVVACLAILFSYASAWFGQDRMSTAKDLITHEKGKKGAQVFASCLKKHQYRVWHSFARSKHCMSLKDQIELYHHDEDWKNTKQFTENYFSNGKVETEAISMIEKILVPILHLVSKESRIQDSCVIIEQTIVPCLKDIDSAIVAALQDKKDCRPLVKLVGAEFTLRHFWAVVNDMTNAVCTIDHGQDGKYCGRVLLNTLSDKSHHMLTAKWKQFTRLAFCRWWVGSCCASPLLHVVQRLQQLKTEKVQWIPGAIALRINKKLRYLAYFFGYCGGYSLNKEDLKWPQNQIRPEPKAGLAKLLSKSVKSDGIMSSMDDFDGSIVEENEAEQADAPPSCQLSASTYYLPSSHEIRLDAKNYENYVSENDDFEQQPISKLMEVDEEDDHKYEIQQVHMAFTAERDNSRLIMWTTVHPMKNSKVIFGLSKNRLNQQVKEVQRTSYTDDFPNGKAGPFLIQVNYHYSAKLSNLQLNKHYYYQVIHPRGKSKVFRFETKDSSEKPVAIFGDFGAFETQTTYQYLKNARGKIGAYLHIGDIGYSDNYFMHDMLSFGYEKVWNAFMRGIESLAAYAPYMVLPGNHDIECHSPFVCMKQNILKEKLSNFTAYNHRFIMPSLASKSKSNLWYSFNYGKIHFIALNTESDYPGANGASMAGIPMGHNNTMGQAKWLERDLKLAQKNRKKQPWIVVLGHRPIYAISGDITSADTNMPVGGAKLLQDWLEPLFLKYKVDLYIAGHKHRYERHGPMHNGKGEKRQRANKVVNAAYTTYIVHGASGNEELHAQLDPTRVLPAWVKKIDDTHYGMGYLNTLGKNTLQWRFESVDTGKVLDKFEITKEIK